MTPEFSVQFPYKDIYSYFDHFSHPKGEVAFKTTVGELQAILEKYLLQAGLSPNADLISQLEQQAMIISIEWMGTNSVFGASLTGLHSDGSISVERKQNDQWQQLTKETPIVLRVLKIPNTPLATAEAPAAKKQEAY